MADRHPPFEDIIHIIIVRCVYPGCDQMYVNSRMSVGIGILVREQAIKAGWRWMRNPGGYSDGLVCPGHAKVLTEDQRSKMSTIRKKRRKRKNDYSRDRGKKGGS